MGLGELEGQDVDILGAIIQCQTDTGQAVYGLYLILCSQPPCEMVMMMMNLL